MRDWSKGQQASVVIAVVLSFVLGGVIGLLGGALAIYGLTLLPNNTRVATTAAPTPGGATKAYVVIGCGVAILLVGLIGRFF